MMTPETQKESNMAYTQSSLSSHGVYLVWLPITLATLWHHFMAVLYGTTTPMVVATGIAIVYDIDTLHLLHSEQAI